MYKAVILSNGKHIIYEFKEDNNWHFPCIINIGKSPEGPFIYFDPMTVFCKDDIIESIYPNHILTTYEPSENIVKAFEEFKKRYHNALNEIEDEDEDELKTIKLIETNGTVH